MAPKYTVDSGMGGTFNVIIIEQDPQDNNRVKVRVTNPGWESHCFWRTRDQLIVDSDYTAPNGTKWWLLTGGHGTGPWFKANKDNNWYIVNVETGQSKKVGPVRRKGTNYSDKASEMAQQRNDEISKTGREIE